MIPCTLEHIQKVVSPLAAQYGAECIYLFGDYAHGEMPGSSDIDLRIGKGNIKGLQLAGLLLNSENSLGHPVDLITTRHDQRFWMQFSMTESFCMNFLNRNIYRRGGK